MRLIDADPFGVIFLQGKSEEFIEGVNFILDKIHEAPTVERPHGEWLSHYDYCKKHGYMPSGLITFWWCNKCEQGVKHPTNFCPNCGADMREGEAE